MCMIVINTSNWCTNSLKLSTLLLYLFKFNFLKNQYVFIFSLNIRSVINYFWFIYVIKIDFLLFYKICFGIFNSSFCISLLK